MLRKITGGGRPLPPHQMFTVGLLLSMMAGYLEAYTFLLRDGVFCNGQTSNIALMALAIVRGDRAQALHYPIPIAAFFVGVVIAGFLRDSMRAKRRFRWDSAFLLLETAVLFWVGFMPLTASSTLPNVLVTFVCAVQYAAFRETGGLPYASIFCTGNLRSAADHLYAYLKGRELAAALRALRYLGMIGAFIVGVLIGATLARAWGARSIWVCCALLLALVPSMMRAENR